MHLSFFCFVLLYFYVGCCFRGVCCRHAEAVTASRDGEEAGSGAEEASSGSEEQTIGEKTKQKANQILLVSIVKN